MKYYIYINAIVIVILTLYHIYNFHNEKKYIKEILEYIKDNMLKKKLNYDLKWYIQRIYYYKYLFYILSITVIEINAIIPVLNSSLAQEKRIIISIISAAATIIGSLMTFTRCNDSWILHRNTFEYLKYEVEKYINNIEEYQDDDAKTIFYKRYREITSKDFMKWNNLREKMHEKSNEKNDTNQISKA